MKVPFDFGGIDTGGGAITPDLSSSAASGDATTGANSVFVGGFNPPVLSSTSDKAILAGVVLAMGLLWYMSKRKR